MRPNVLTLDGASNGFPYREPNRRLSLTNWRCEYRNLASDATQFGRILWIGAACLTVSGFKFDAADGDSGLTN